MYGLAFFIFGMTILLFPKNKDAEDIVEHISLIGVFGVLHGINEWIDMFGLIDPSPLLSFFGLIMLTLSYAALLLFGLLTLQYRYPKLNNTYILIIIASVITLVSVIAMQSMDPILHANVWARYIIGLPGIFLTAIAPFLHRDILKSRLIVQKKFFVVALSVTFFIYGLLAGLVVPTAPVLLASYINQDLFYEYVGIPVQVFRMLCAVAAAFISLKLLQLLRYELFLEINRLAKVVEVSGDNIVVTDLDSVITYANPAFLEHSGFVKEEIYGQKPSIFKSGIHPESFYKKLWDTILGGGVFREYMINKKKNGVLYHEYKAIAPILDSKGQIVGFASSGKDVTKHMELEEKYKLLAMTDKLTGIANRQRFDEAMQRTIEASKHHNTPLSLILFDIDNFKQINDTYGHLRGDDVLKTVAEISSKNIRKGDLIARWGGEEFIILQSNCPANEAAILAERIRENIQNHIHPFEQKITASFGITALTNDDESGSFITRADKALYRAKTSGKNKVAVL